jgi:hypothetical protein
MYTKSFERKRGGAGGRMGEYIRGVVKTPVSCWDGRVAGSWRLDLCTEYVL